MCKALTHIRVRHLSIFCTKEYPIIYSYPKISVNTFAYICHTLTHIHQLLFRHQQEIQPSLRQRLTRYVDPLKYMQPKCKHRTVCRIYVNGMRIFAKRFYGKNFCPLLTASDSGVWNSTEIKCLTKRQNSVAWLLQKRRKEDSNLTYTWSQKQIWERSSRFKPCLCC